MTYKIKEGEDWVLYRSPVVEHEQEEMLRQLGRGYRLFKDTFTGLDSSLRQEGLTLGALQNCSIQTTLRRIESI